LRLLPTAAALLEQLLPDVAGQFLLDLAPDPRVLIAGQEGIRVGVIVEDCR
jgi:hypothetical protein